jgi:hypothetical protein
MKKLSNIFQKEIINTSISQHIKIADALMHVFSGSGPKPGLKRGSKLIQQATFTQSKQNINNEAPYPVSNDSLDHIEVGGYRANTQEQVKLGVKITSGIDPKKIIPGLGNSVSRAMNPVSKNTDLNISTKIIK